MYIITLSNQIFEYYYDSENSGYNLLYHTEEVSLRAQVYRNISRPAWAALAGEPEGICLVETWDTGTRTYYPVGTSRGRNLGPYIGPRISLDSEDAPVLGAIPPDHIEVLCQSITLLTAKPVKAHLELQEKLLKELDRLQGP